MNARAPRPFLQLVVDNTEAAALRARNLQLADDIETISDIARGGRIGTFAWIIVRPNGETEQGILGKQGTDLTGVLRGARNLQKIVQKRIDEGANASQGARL
ncbi:hypothetical protein [uncultured Zoogloea sp.]|jgi:hypothetical protein|uniref:hypothetical protein n=1 Tax=uncultured Zoogloea sp. TaxID=160237 RepID=UPI0011DB5274|nr:hypothetical protein [uncultured Zoogloea sp.]TXH46911.1 MAG: hypothetical protein E6Q92_01320 [Burkholderiaceae bacterium]